LLVENLHELHSRYVLREKRVYLRYQGACPPEIRFRLYIEQHSRENYERDNTEADKRDTPIHQQHDPDYPRYHKHVLEQVDDDPGIQLTYRLDVVRDARKQAARRVRVEKFQRHTLYMREHLHTYFVDYRLAHIV